MEKISPYLKSIKGGKSGGEGRGGKEEGEGRRARGREREEEEGVQRIKSQAVLSEGDSA